MSTEGRLIQDSATRLFATQCDRTVLRDAAQGKWPALLWQAVEDAGLDRAMVPETHGGAGVDPVEALALIGLAAEHAAPIPLAETLIASWLAARAGLDAPAGALTFGTGDVRAARTGQGWHVTGRTLRTPWGRDAAAVLLLAQSPDGEPWLSLIDRNALTIEPGENLAAEPRDTLIVDVQLDEKQAKPSPVSHEDLRALGAAVRTMQIAGALRRTANIAIDYAQQRVQFGKPISKFQAVQQNLAVLTTQVALAGGAAQLAIEAIANDNLPSAGVAKACAGEAAGVGAAIAHQVLGATGFTLEHDLQFFTKRMLAWRDEFGAEAEWSARLGARLLAAGPNRLWPEITAI